MAIRELNVIDGVMNASREGVVNVLNERIAIWCRQNKWLQNDNHYKANCIRTLSRELSKRRVRNPRGTRIPRLSSHADLKDYIASSAILHCSDGWHYLGKAILANLLGDMDIARHLGYYAELRAAMAILASEGIGIFNQIHISINTSRSCTQFRPGDCQAVCEGSGTHKVTWGFLKEWANTQPARNLLEVIITPSSVPLSVWVAEFLPGGRIWQSFASDWLTTWGVDLQKLALDGISRNEASYRPTELKERPFNPPSEALRFVKNAWLPYEPSVTSRFDLLDRHLLRLLLENVFNAENNFTRDQFPERYRTWITELLIRMAHHLPVQHHWLPFLLRDIEPDDLDILGRAEMANLDILDPSHHSSVISRASLLLRIASGSCANLLEEADIDRAELAFWWQPLGERYGIWPPNAEPDDFTTLWAEVEESIEKLELWEVNNPDIDAIGSYHHIRQELSEEILILSSFERVGLWGLGL